MWASIRAGAPTVLFGALFVAVGAGFTYTALAAAIHQRSHAAELVRGECTITRNEVASHDDSDGDTMYTPVVRYELTVGGTRHEGHRIGFSARSASMRSYAEGVLESYPVGARRPCWYAPGDPSDVVLDRSTSLGVVVSLIPLGFCLVGLAVLVSAFTRSRTSRGGLVARGGGRSGPLVLRARGEHAFDLLWSGGFAVCFGLGSVAVIEMAWSSGSVSSWVMALLFGAVGLGLTLWFLRNLLRVVGPRPRLVLDASSVRVGGSVGLRYGLRGLPLDVLGWVSLVGREEATYTEGTRSVTDTHEFHRAELASLVESPAGSVVVQIPAGSMHSLHTDHNRIVWLIEVKGHFVTSWLPGLDEAFELDVEPAEVES